MNAFTIHKGKVAGLDRANVDTDQIIPKQFLKRIERTGFGQFLFYDWRYKADGSLNESFELNAPENQGATILVANENFGCGSSREHAPWSLLDYGFQVVIAPSFADIFKQNCLKNGMLPISLPLEDVEYLLEEAKSPYYECTINLYEQSIKDGKGFSRTFDINGHFKNMLLNGWDEIGYTLSFVQDIDEYEKKVTQFV
ncbi:3-isopropylmalate dehydratase small subunit [Metabacillus iocasae]|uniref:3-isopropylmalate dehydratase small subunit n=1 Tax=Priestia iocasae TaxID=2291674 RepID=A0ABS2QPF9_9BACI|nr:3-isopropylmalate dehydratase small subunit [Metabacillus iocasae]MBM7701327.1 3-isopropylmalate/(R)-2-methylmalate dehydratase small subunit [Metabacillus iocasae]